MGMWSVDHSFGIVMIQKVASNTVATAIRDTGKHFAEETAHEFKKLHPRYAFIREPMSRIESAYRMFRKEGDERAKVNMGGPAYAHNIESFEEFVLHACYDAHNDPHVFSQMQHCAPKGEFLPTDIIRWDFEALAKILGLEKVQRLGPSDKSIQAEWTPQAEAQFRQSYASDIKLWNDL